MNVFAIADLHLSFTAAKPMSVFGPQWADHERRVEAAWRKAVGAEDVVLLPGDLSWALKLEDALPDLRWIGALPGRKYFIQGNHDYWCGPPGKVRSALPPSLSLVRSGAERLDGLGLCGTRGWTRPDQEEFDPDEDGRLWRREVARLGMALEALARLDAPRRIVMLHFPPRGPAEPTEMSRMIEAAGADLCVYGHLHAEALSDAFEGESGGVAYRCVSADHIGFAPRLVLSL